MWYVDRRDGKMKYRLLGIAAMGNSDPLMLAEKTADGQMLGNKDELIDLFWVFYPDAREVLLIRLYSMVKIFHLILLMMMY